MYEKGVLTFYGALQSCLYVRNKLHSFSIFRLRDLSRHRHSSFGRKSNRKGVSYILTPASSPNDDASFEAVAPGSAWRAAIYRSQCSRKATTILPM